jgi:protein O-mannosyl-transferase
MEQPTTMPVPRRVTILSALGLFLVIAAIFSGVARCDFIFYDDPAIFDEPWITGGLTLHNVGVVFSTFQHCLWVPLTWVSFMADVSLFGLNPGAMHLMNVAWHAGAAVLLFFALRRLTGRHWPSLIVAALFGVHPINVESVAWVVERKNVLCGFFFMLALFFWSDWAVERKRRGWWLALGSFALALMAKPMAVTFPCLLLLLDVWPLRRLTLANGIRVTLEKIPFFIGSAVVSVLASQAGKAHSYTLEELALDARITNALCSYGAYLRDLVWPSGLALTHGHPLVAQWLPATGALGVLLALLALALWQRRARPYLLIGLLAFLGMLVPNLGLVQIGPALRTSRRSGFSSRSYGESTPSCRPSGQCGSP